mgnify:CR=1 FL=1|jgi:hypothetical protein
MKTFSQFREGFLDDLVGDLEGFVQDKPQAKVLTNKFAEKIKKKALYVGEVHPTNAFPEWIRGESAIKGYMKDYDIKKLNLPGIIKLFGLHNVRLTESIVLNIDIDEVYNVREWDRNVIPGYGTGTNTEDEFEALRKSIEDDGIRDAGVINMTRLKDGDIEVYLGEGNHRLAIAKALGMKYMPITFRYR